MRIVIVGCLVAGCVLPPRVQDIAADRLGVRGKRLHLDAYEQVDGSDVYVFCRRETGREHALPIPHAPRMYDGACVTIVCPAGDDGRRCRW